MPVAVEHAVATLVSRLAQVVAAQPRRPALFRGEEVWSYRDFWARAERVARSLLESGVPPGSRVGLVGRNSIDYVVAYVGIMRAGSAVVVPNPLLDADELREQLAHAEVAAILLGDALDSVGDELVELAGAVAISSLEAHGGEPLPGPDAGDAAVLIPTTGSTGTPKCAALTHAAMVHAADQLAAVFPVSREDVTVSFLPLHASIYEQVLPIMLSGGAVDVLPRYDPEAVSRACERGTTFDAVPTVIARLLESADHRALNRLRWIMFASEPMPPAVLERWWECVPDVKTYQFYGMTELLTITQASHELLVEERQAVGVPFASSAVRVVGDDGEERPAGEEGEVVCCSPTLMQEYFRDEAATALALGRDGSMRTGDLGAFDEAGRLHLRGRLKDIIISGGFNIAPAEIEAVACNHPAVAEAMVVGIPDDRWGETPVVVAVPRRDSGLTAAELLGHCRDRLAAFKRPSAAAVTHELPTTGIGKAEKAPVRDAIQRGELDVERAS